jgi:hypothetical protein
MSHNDMLRVLESIVKGFICDNIVPGH